MVTGNGVDRAVADCLIDRFAETEDGIGHYEARAVGDHALDDAVLESRVAKTTPELAPHLTVRDVAGVNADQATRHLLVLAVDDQAAQIRIDRDPAPSVQTYAAHID